MTWCDCQDKQSSFSGSASESIRETATDNTRYAEQAQEREPACWMPAELVNVTDGHFTVVKGCSGMSWRKVRR